MKHDPAVSSSRRSAWKVAALASSIILVIAFIRFRITGEYVPGLRGDQSPRELPGDSQAASAPEFQAAPMQSDLIYGSKSGMAFPPQEDPALLPGSKTGIFLPLDSTDPPSTQPEAHSDDEITNP